MQSAGCAHPRPPTTEHCGLWSRRHDITRAGDEQLFGPIQEGRPAGRHMRKPPSTARRTFVGSPLMVGVKLSVGLLVSVNHDGARSAHGDRVYLKSRDHRDLELVVHSRWLETPKPGLKKRPWWLLSPRFESRCNSTERACFFSKTATHEVKGTIRRNVQAHNWLDSGNCES